MAFELSKFVTEFEFNPTIEMIHSLKKTELLDVCKHYKVDAKVSMKKVEIKQLLVEYLVDENVLPEILMLESVQKVESSDVEIRKLELEQEIRLKEIMLKEKEIEAQLRIKECELEAERLKHSRTPQPTREFDISRNIRLVPPFHEKDIDKYFLHFEKVGEKCKWPRDVWTLLLQSVLVGKAQEAYSALSSEQSSDYETVKKAILKAYELVPEAYRQKFRNTRKSEGQTYVEFARDKEVLFTRWCTSKDVANFEQLRQLILVEEFKRQTPSDIRSHLDEHQVNDLHMAATMADDYSLTHKSTFHKVGFHSSGGFKKKPYNSVTVTQQTEASVEKDAASSKDSSVCNDDHSKQNKGAYSKKICSYCKKHGHLKDECWFLERKKNSSSKPTALTANVSQSDIVRQEFEPFISNGFVSYEGENTQFPIKILRDTGASQSLLLDSVLPESSSSPTGSSVLIQGVEGGYVNVPLHQVNLKSDLVSGPVVVGLRPKLPVQGISLLLGNDLAGGKVLSNPLMTEKPEADDITKSCDENTSLFPACVVTRSMREKMSKETDDKYGFDLGNTFLAEINQQVESSSNSPVKQDKEGTDPGDYIEPVVNKQQLISEQEKDPELSLLCKSALSEDEISQVPVCYFKKSGVLMRKWRPKEVPASDEWQVLYQIVVPPVYRKDILSLAHENAMAGHLGINKTCDRILRHFYWPKIRSDVSQFCKTCHTCQMVGKPNQKIPKAPLRPIPVVEEPFSRVVVDCVGPLPRSRSGHEYLLTIMCTTTRFPEAIPLRKITAPAIVKALIKFFTLVGLPKSIQSDQGTNFMSNIFKQVMKELGIKQHTSSAYHPESQGVLERFHQTLKSMLRTYCFENGKDWEDGVPLALFAVREVVQESLGFSPFELVFGHTVRGPLKLLKEKWLAEESNESNLLSYVSKFKERLAKACEMAKVNLKDAQRVMKSNYDKKSKPREFKVGDKVLVMLPVSGQALQARYNGPYTIIHKVSDVDYVVKTPDRRKEKQLCHVNMLKQYHDRDQSVQNEVVATSVQETECDVSVQDDTVEGDDIGCSIKLQNSTVLNDLEGKTCHLSPEKQNELCALIREYSHLFPDVPSKTDVFYHDVDVGNNKPIKQHPYRANPIKREYLNEEVKFMLKNEIIEASHSEWSSPCLLVPKPDKTFRFCTDYRKVNAVTKTDSFPIPRMEDCIEQVGHSKYVTKLDLLKGYYQVPLTERAIEISAFVTPDGLYEYKVMPFGMKNAGATFQRLMYEVIFELKGCEVYIDDLIIYSDTWEQHVKRISALFDRLTEAKLTVNLVKSEFSKAIVTYLGHEVGQGQVRPIQAKVDAIVNLPQPTNKRELMRFIGMTGYYRRFCKNFSEVISPMTNLLSKDVEFHWSTDCQMAFEKVKAVLSHYPVLQAPNFQKAFKLSVDASDVGAGAVLQQDDEHGIDHPVCYFSKKFTKYQRNYSTIEKETLALILALNHFDVYLCTTYTPIIVYTDHNPLVFINKMKNKNQRIMRWSLILQEYDVEIYHVKGRENIIADSLSRSV